MGRQSSRAAWGRGYTVTMQAVLEAIVVLVASSIAAASFTAALSFLRERQWPAVGFLSLVASTAITYGMLLMAIVRGVFSRG